MSSDTPIQGVSDSPINSSSPTQESSEQHFRAAPSSTSIDSETVLLNPQSDAPTDKDSRPTPRRTDTDLKQCWICYVDETEDTPTTSRWRSPCPCALVAHESCLLDWVADLEAPGSSRSRTSPAKIQCPQCKKDIVIARPRSYIVQATKSVERLGSRLVVPAIVLALGGSVYTGATMHGIVSTYLVFGREDFDGLLGGPQIPAKWLVAFPLIPVALIVSRTSIIDQMLPQATILIWAIGIPQTLLGYGSSQLWPPTAGVAFAALPFISSVYRQLWRTFFAKKEAEWVRQVKPRANETAEANDAEIMEEAQAGNGAELDIFNFQVEILDEDEVPEAAEIAEPEIPAHEVEAEPANNNGDAVPVADNNAARPRPRQQQRGLTVSGAYIADIIMGALAFPSVAAAMGHLLKYSLRASWVNPPTYILRLGIGGKHSFTSTTSPPFLASQWARSLVGGCLFVVMKDTLLLYSKYRIAKDHQKRRICNWDKRLGRIVD